MTDDGTITNRMLLEHIQASKQEVMQRIDSLEARVERRFATVDRRFTDIDRKFEEARLHRQALQEDLEATIQMQFKHQKQLGVLTGQSISED